MSIKSTELSLLRIRMKRYETNHILHLIISVLTGGGWVLIWLLVALSNSIERNRIANEMRKIA